MWILAYYIHANGCNGNSLRRPFFATGLSQDCVIVSQSIGQSNQTGPPLGNSSCFGNIPLYISFSAIWAHSDNNRPSRLTSKQFWGNRSFADVAPSTGQQKTRCTSQRSEHLPNLGLENYWPIMSSNHDAMGSFTSDQRAPSPSLAKVASISSRKARKTSAYPSGYGASRVNTHCTNTKRTG